jgi:hypothetical protein
MRVIVAALALLALNLPVAAQTFDPPPPRFLGPPHVYYHWHVHHWRHHWR